MADLPAYRESNSDTSDDTGVGSDSGSSTTYPGTPRWVKVSGIVVLVLVLLVVGVMVVGGGQHGPMRHVPSGAPAGHTPPVVGAQQP